MKRWIKRTLWTLATLVFTFIGFAIVLAYVMGPTIEVPVAEGYDPACPADQPSCAVWASFRRSHPYPYQAIAVKFSVDGRAFVILSEPPPSVDLATLNVVAKKAFGDDVRMETRRWMIGVDGWLEDVVFTLPSVKDDSDGLRSKVRDGSSVLAKALFGTNYGTELEEIVEALPGVARLEVPPFHVTPKELGGWMSDPKLMWQTIHDDSEPLEWSALAAQQRSGAYASSDGSLVLLTFPYSRIREAGPAGDGLDEMKRAFREFAVSSEGIVGGLWTATGQIALVSRMRTSSQQVAPALRFETFKTIAVTGRDTDELAQSYERRLPFTGKLKEGSLYQFRDWAPIYLSPQLLDTELGALLNVTDQMLKSWSSAGTVEYLYFNYAKPSAFPFGSEPLSDIVYRQTGESSLLFNWNTAGSAVVVRRDDFSLLTSGTSGSLPVTYGAGNKTARQGGADLYAYETKAYKYFSELGDPNLQRVVQYTVMYQLLRAAAKDFPAAASFDAGTLNDNASKAVAAARAELVKSTSKFLREFAAKPSAFEPKEASKTLVAFMREQSALDEMHLAGMLSDRNSEDARRFVKALSAADAAREAELRARAQSLIAKVNAHNTRVSELARGDAARATPQDAAELAAANAAIDAERTALGEEMKKLEAQRNRNPLRDAMDALWTLVRNTQDLEATRASYVSAFDHQPSGRIRTPSVVLSWHSRDTLMHVGGHNLNSRALRFEAAPDVQGIVIRRSPDGSLVVKFNPSQADAVESAAPQIARSLEHGKTLEQSQLDALIANAAPARSRSDALLLNSTAKEKAPANAFARLGERVYVGKEPFVEDLRSLANDNDCCVFIIHDAKRNAYVAEANPKPPPLATVYEVFDTPSLVDRLGAIGQRRREGNGKAAIFLDEPDGFVESLVQSLKEPRSTTAGGGRSGGSPPNGRGGGFSQPDFDGRRSSLTAWIDQLDAAQRKVSERFLAGMGRKISSESWLAAKVEKIESAELNLTALQWDTARDGSPVGVKVSLHDSGQNVDRSLEVIAGVDDAAMRADMLLSANRKAVGDAAQRDASMGQYLLTVKQRLGQLDEKQLRRLVLVARTGESKLYFTQVMPPKANRSNKGIRGA